jgi:hypothetical protein
MNSYMFDKQNITKHYISKRYINISFADIFNSQEESYVYRNKCPKYEEV